MTHPGDILTATDIAIRDSAIGDGVAQCRQLLRIATRPQDLMYYQGAIHGFEDCRTLQDLGAFTQRCEDLQWRLREESRRSIADPKLRAELGLDANERANDNKTWFLEGRNAQIRHVYERIMSARARRWSASLFPVAYAPGIDSLLR